MASNYYPKSQQKYLKKYRDEVIDQILLRVPKGKRAEFKHYADLQGKSLNQFILDCVNEKILDIEFFADK